MDKLLNENKVADLYIGIGVSTGGTEALASMFSNMFEDTNAAYIIVLHLSAEAESAIDTVLKKVTNIPVLTAEAGMILSPNTIYINMPGRLLSIKNGKFVLSDDSESLHNSRPIDHMFKSLSKEKKKNCIGIILSGGGMDGKEGADAIKEAGGIVIVQEPETAEHTGMVKNVIASGIPDYVLRPEEMGYIIDSYADNYVKNIKKPVVLSGENNWEYTNILSILKNYTGIDFSSYKENTILRRIQKRMEACKADTLSEYLDLLIVSKEEKEALYKDMFIGVTSFIRDENAFKSLSENVIPKIYSREKDEIRIWSIACSTGEEAYSAAIMFQELKELNHCNVSIKIFATDIDKRAIEYAQAGIYSALSVQSMPKKYIESYFEQVGAGYKVKECIRKMVVFAQHDILRDAPFSRLDLIICRNVFIYFRTEVQRNIVSDIYKLLKPEGYLFLGTSESLGPLAEAYHVIDNTWKIYQKNSSYLNSNIKEYSLFEKKGIANTNTIINLKNNRKDEQSQLYEKILKIVLEPAVLLNEKGEILQILKDADKYLRFGIGDFNNHIQACVHDELKIAVGSILYQLKDNDRDTFFQKVYTQAEFKGQVLWIRGNKLTYAGNIFYLFQFVYEKEEQDNAVISDRDEFFNQRIIELERALNESNIRLQNAVEELEFQNNELMASNEEFQSMNEELQSVNEELYSVNTEHHHMIEELLKANSDFNNLLYNAEIGALFIDNQLYIRTITPIIEKNTNLVSSDEGRPISHVHFLDEYADYANDVKASLKNLTTIEKEFNDKNGIVWMVRTKPYYDSDNKVNGVLTTMFDITKRLQAAKIELKILMESIPGGVVRLRYDGGLLVEYASEGAAMLGAYTWDDIRELHNNYYDRTIFEEDWSMVRSSVEAAIKNNELINIRYRICTKNREHRWRNLHAKLIENDRGPVLLGIITDITDLIRTQINLNSIIDSVPGGIIRVYYNGNESKIVFVSDGLYEMIGYTKDEYTKIVEMNDNNRLFLFGEHVDEMYKKLDESIINGIVPIQEYSIMSKSGKDIWVQIRGNIVSKRNEGIMIQYVVIDITELKDSYLALQREREKMDIIVNISADLLFEYDIKENVMYYNNIGKGILLPSQIMPDYRNETIRLNLIHPEDIIDFNCFCDELARGKESIYAEIRKMYIDGQYHWIEIVGRTILDEKGIPYRVIGKTSNIDERKEKEEQLRNQTDKDLLTNLYNSTAIKQRINKLLNSMHNETGVIFLIDVDNFQNINDSLGRLFGDAVICSIADELRIVFNNNSMYGRIGGDEFVSFIKNQSLEDVIKIALNLKKSVEKIYIDDSGNFNISCSIGIAMFPQDGDTYEELYKKADSALYYMKSTNKKGYFIYNDDDCGQFIEEGLSYLTGYDIKRDADRSIVCEPQSIVLFALELLDKTIDINSAINIIFDRMSRYFDIETISLIIRRDSSKTELEYEWSKNREKYVLNDNILSDEFFDMLKVNSVGQDVSVFNTEEQGIFISIIVSDKENFKGYMLFFGKSMNKKTDAEKQDIKAVASLLAGRLFRMQENKKNNEQLDYLLNYDSLTGFPNYTKFLQLAEQEIAANPEEKYFVIYCDFNNFKFINETYGYNEGDTILKKFAQVLQKECREGVYFSRINSDKFTILLKGMDIDTHRKNFIQIVRQFCTGINKEYDKGNIVIIAGISEADRNLPFISSSVDRGNIARKSIKNLGESECAEFSEFLQVQTNRQFAISRSMAGALENKEFVVYLQPKIDLHTERIIGAEALVRWQRDGDILFYPDSFIPLFEQNGFVTKLDYYVLEQVLIWIKGIMERGEEVIPISLNFSRRHQKEEDFVERVVEFLEKYQVPSEYIEAEITESIFMSDFALLNDNLRMMKESGIAVSIDDFGSGYSSLNVLASVSADIIKLDKEFLNQLGGTSGTDFLRQLIRMIKRLGFKVIAEGVETKEQKDLLVNVGCDMAQGYYYARPMPIEKFQDYIKEHKERFLKDNL